MKDKIQIQILCNKQWYNIDLENLRKDNIIRIFINEELQKDPEGFSIRKCICDSYIDKNETWHIKSERIKLDENIKEIK